MTVKPNTPKNFDEYVADFPADVQVILKEIRVTIRRAAPDAAEKISYRIPAFTLNGDLVYFAAFKRHIGLYPPIRGGDTRLRKEKAPYEGPKGNLKFPLDEPIPYTLIGRIVKLRVKENLDKTSTEAKKKGMSSVGGVLPQMRINSPDAIAHYGKTQTPEHAAICNALRAKIDAVLPKATSKIWHGSPVWFVGENPVVGYSVTSKKGVTLLFWNGQSFGEAALKAVGKFRAAQIQFTDVSEIDPKALRRYLKSASSDIWDYHSYFLSQKALQKKGKQ
jgi:uncharacterized protein YdhG (YjbR/CyaY superfamily)